MKDELRQAVDDITEAVDILVSEGCSTTAIYTRKALALLVSAIEEQGARIEELESVLDLVGQDMRDLMPLPADTCAIVEQAIKTATTLGHPVEVV